MNIVSGGQTGVDRAALDVAIERGMDWGGWCPKGGWAEDLTEPPGVLTRYPKLKETPLANPVQRTEWNVRDADATLVGVPERPTPESNGASRSPARWRDTSLSSGPLRVRIQRLPREDVPSHKRRPERQEALALGRLSSAGPGNRGKGPDT
jgi:hypothetical protein